MKLFLTIFLVLLPMISKAITLEEWSMLNKNERFDILQNEELRVSELSLKKPHSPELKKLFNDLTPYLLNNLSTEAIEQGVWSQEIIFLIGEPRISYIEIHSISEKPVAITVGMYQDGGATFDNKEPPKKYYSDKSEAINAGLNVQADVSWSSRSFLNYDGIGFSEIEFDVYNVGGFGWSGW